MYSFFYSKLFFGLFRMRIQSAHVSCWNHQCSLGRSVYDNSCNGIKKKKSNNPDENCKTLENAGNGDETESLDGNVEKKEECRARSSLNIGRWSFGKTSQVTWCVKRGYTMRCSRKRRTANSRATDRTKKPPRARRSNRSTRYSYTIGTRFGFVFIFYFFFSSSSSLQ